MIEFTVPIKAEPQGSSIGFSPLNSRRVTITSANKKLKPYRAVLSSYAIEAVRDYHGLTPNDEIFAKSEPVKLTVVFSFLRPRSIKNRAHHTVKPDLDKLVRGVNDALSGIIWYDDSQVCEIDARKVYGYEENVHIRVEAL